MFFTLSVANLGAAVVMERNMKPVNLLCPALV